MFIWFQQLFPLIHQQMFYPFPIPFPSKVANITFDSQHLAAVTGQTRKYEVIINNTEDQNPEVKVLCVLRPHGLGQDHLSKSTSPDLSSRRPNKPVGQAGRVLYRECIMLVSQGVCRKTKAQPASDSYLFGKKPSRQFSI